MTAVGLQPRRVVRVGSAIRSREPFGIAFPGNQLFAAYGGIQGARGVQGIPGPAAGSAFQRLAGENISALRVAYELDGLVYALDYRDSSHINLLLGITLTAADEGDPVDLQRSGVIEDAGWNWDVGRVWLGLDGRLTQTPPATDFDVLIGSATSPTCITLNIQDPIDLTE